MRTGFSEFSRLDALLEAALERPAEEREAFLRAECGDDSAMRDRLRRLIELAEEGKSMPPGGAMTGTIWDEFAREVAHDVPHAPNGNRLGRYELRGVLGRGGMGRVYRAYDPVLAREVAIKVVARALPADAAGPYRRFELEARLLAAVSHPNIATIHAFEEIEGCPCLIMELVEGPTLAERLRAGPISREEAIAIARQIALALEEAHRRGIVHRDLKPSNVKLDAEGRVKILDFGIAKLLAPASVDAASGGVEVGTASGTVLGTAAYMSPEQARGEAVDQRTDIWAFGCLIYEMLTARPVFDGASTADVLAAVLRDEVNFEHLPSDTAAALKRLVRRCLRRDPRERLQHIGDARIELDELAQEGPEDAAEISMAPRQRGRFPWIAVSAALGSALLAAAIVRAPREPPDEPGTFPLARLSVDLPATLQFANDFGPPFAIADDGSRLVLLATQDGIPRLYVRGLDELDVKPLAGTEGAWQPFLSPDGRSVAFFADRKLKRVSVDGSRLETLAEIGGSPRGASWGPDEIVLAPSQASGLVRIAAGGGSPTPLTRLDPSAFEGTHRWPQVLPGGRWVLFTVGPSESTFDEASLHLVCLQTGERRQLIERASYGRYAGGKLFFTRDGRILAVDFDVEQLSIHGSPQVVIDGVRYDQRNGAAHFAISESGTIIYAHDIPTSPEFYLAWVDAAGKLIRIAGSPRRFQEPRLSPDGTRVAVVVDDRADSDLWVVETNGGTLSRLTFGLAPHYPIWAPDGRSITVGAWQEGRWRLLAVPSDGPAPPGIILEGATSMYPNAWAPDGSFLVFQERRRDDSRGWDLKRLDVDGEFRPIGAARVLTTGKHIERKATISPDGRFVAYESNQLDGVMGIHVAPLSEIGKGVRATSTNGQWPRWAATGDLYFWYGPHNRPGDLTPAGVHKLAWRPSAPAPFIGSSVPLWADLPTSRDLLDRIVVGSFASFDVDTSTPAPRFLVLETSVGPTEAPLERPVVVVGWLDHLRGRAGR